MEMPINSKYQSKRRIMIPILLTLLSISVFLHYSKNTNIEEKEITEHSPGKLSESKNPDATPNPPGKEESTSYFDKNSKELSINPNLTNNETKSNSDLDFDVLKDLIKGSNMNMDVVLKLQDYESFTQAQYQVLDKMSYTSELVRITETHLKFFESTPSFQDGTLSIERLACSFQFCMGIFQLPKDMSWSEIDAEIDDKAPMYASSRGLKENEYDNMHFITYSIDPKVRGMVVSNSTEIVVD